VIFRHGEGFANVESRLSPNGDTLYCVASCTKAFTTATCIALEREEKLSWKEPISRYVPDFNPVNDPEIGRRATLLDLSSHTTGLAPVDHSVMGFHDEYYNKGSDQVRIASHLPVCYDFRSHWLYNNCMLGVVGEVISAVCKQSTGTVLKERIFEPLGMTRTCTSNAEYPDQNVAKGYSVLDDGSLLSLGDPLLEDGDIQGAAGFVRSSVNDMLTWAKAIMVTENQERGMRSLEIGSELGDHPLRGISLARCAHRPITLENGPGENAYGLGWFRHTLPSSWLGSIGPNFALLKDPPIIGRKSKPRLAVSHYGEFQGFLAAFYTFPETCSAVIVLANTSPSRGDPTDLIAQALIQELFDMQPRVALENYALQARRASDMIWPALVESWVSNRVQNTPRRPPLEYVGRYENPGFMLVIDVYELPDSEKGKGSNPEVLGFTVNSIKRQSAKLRHYHYDVFTFLPDSRDDALRKGMEGYMALPLLLLSFLRGACGKVCGLEWDLQAGICEGPAPGLEKIVHPIRFKRV